MTRNEMRKNIMKLMYQADIHNDYMFDFFVKAFEKKEGTSPVEDSYFTETVKAFIDYKTVVDKEISDNLKKWDLDRIGKVELAIMRLAVTEMLYIDDIPAKVSINEAIELAKSYADDKSPKYINGVLATILKKQEND